MTKLGTYLVLRRIWNPIDFQGQRSRSPGQIVRLGDMPRFALPLFPFVLFDFTNKMNMHCIDLSTNMVFPYCPQTKLYDKRDDFNFPIVNFSFICSNNTAAPAYRMYISQLIRLNNDFEKWILSSGNKSVILRKNQLYFNFNLFWLSRILKSSWTQGDWLHAPVSLWFKLGMHLVETPNNFIQKAWLLYILLVSKNNILVCQFIQSKVYY